MSVVKPRVFYRANGCVCIGPLGCFDRESVVDVEGVKMRVARVAPDGAAECGPVGVEVPRFPCQPLSNCVPSQREKITGQILANRARHGLSPVDPRQAA